MAMATKEICPKNQRGSVASAPRWALTTIQTMIRCDRNSMKTLAARLSRACCRHCGAASADAEDELYLLFYNPNMFCVKHRDRARWLRTA